MSINLKKRLSKSAKLWLMANKEPICEECRTPERLTIDHIIPIMILTAMGFTVEEMFEDMDNLRLLCRECNTKKNCQLDFKDPRTKPLLLKYLERV